MIFSPNQIKPQEFNYTMEFNSTNKITKASVKDRLLNDQTSRRRKHLKFIITLIIFFSIIIAAIISVLTMIKRDYDSESPANNPDKAIKSICSLTAYHQPCIRYMSNSLYKNNQLPSSSKINPSLIFSLSLHTTINELQKLSSLIESNNSPSESTPSQCKSLFNSSVSQLNSYMAIDDDKNLTAIMGWLDTELPRIEMCLNWLKYEKGLDTKNVRNSLMILAKMKVISEMLEPTSGNVLGFGLFRSSGESILAKFLSDKDLRETMCIFGWQYIFLLILVCVLLCVW